MKSAFLDTNILLDVLLNREPFVTWAQQIWTLAIQKKIKASISAASLLNCFYIIRKVKTNEQTYTVIENLVKIFHVIAVDSKIISKALQTRFDDFEDGVQYQCALKARSQTIITRDPKGFVKSKIQILDPLLFTTQ